jgi:hypothetical protein
MTNSQILLESHVTSPMDFFGLGLMKRKLFCRRPRSECHDLENPFSTPKLSGWLFSSFSFSFFVNCVTYDCLSFESRKKCVVGKTRS